jgi:hypothetical protein
VSTGRGSTARSHGPTRPACCRLQRTRDAFHGAADSTDVDAVRRTAADDAPPIGTDVGAGANVAQQIVVTGGMEQDAADQRLGQVGDLDGLAGWHRSPFDVAKRSRLRRFHFPAAQPYLRRLSRASSPTVRALTLTLTLMHARLSLSRPR